MFALFYTCVVRYECVVLFQPVLDVVDGETAIDAVVASAIVAVQLQECLRVCCAAGNDSLFTPLLCYAVLLTVNLVHQFLGSLAESFILAVFAIDVKHGDNRVDDDYIHLLLSHATVATCLGSAEACVVLPITVQGMAEQSV